MSTSIPFSLRSRSRLIAAAVAVALTAGTLAVLAPASSASAASYPSWDEVQQAKSSTSAQQAKVSEIKSLISSLKGEAAAKQKAAQAAGEAYQAAQNKYDEATLKQKKFQSQADEAKQTAARSEEQAGQLAAQLGRTSGDDVTTDILTHPSDSGDLLYELGAMSKLSEQSEGIYAQASQDRGVAQGLADKADRAKQALGDLADAAQSKMQQAQGAADAAQTAVDAQNDNESRLEAQLTALTSKQRGVEADYRKGVAAEKARQARLAAAAAKAAAKAAATSQGGTGGGSANPAGWVRPAGGFQTSPYGYRVDPYTHVSALHAGVDLAPACYAPIYAAHDGTVTFAGNGGGYGNEVILDNGGGISTAYGHVVDGGIMVTAGQHVTAGQQIAKIGSTGWSTGCHLHFETRINGAAVDPVPFMAARGISV
ncbi:peptidoglycan DD-metalloendopeptidase family protein [Curtobacterium flaccumfaciens pv. flaccumfaciens]|uniref:M23 family metallopeptidase n=1 Tax=Curtobacterium flaccumfaciens TaxID=2035 RepID=UPI001ADAC200|nr:M23 family metallopeptidase [Curtobacterium flaccumfaciens]MBO9045866.1 peptidoglycan DD-metalloendopeptidase family protein [Curtobacterium flaccumfaciens pv. flaccumfaciens]QTR90966.1 peptidoglycan DD-metalloendopeptidase family protein [Curtobacterium flaccumfaciens pv. flaccumfaciens]